MALIPAVFRNSVALRAGMILTAAALLCPAVLSQRPASGKLIAKIDSSVAARDDNLLGYTVTEQYKVYRGTDKAHPAAQMTVKTTYRKDSGKSYVTLAESGSQLLLKEVLARVLDSERLMTQPANRSQAVLTSSNYDMSIKGEEPANGLPCTVLAIAPRRSSPYLFKGRIWVDPQDGSIVKLNGVASKSASILAGATQVSRRYEKIDGFPMATHAEAVADSWLLGHTVIDIDYTDYKMTLRNATGSAQSPPQTLANAPHQ